MLDNINGIVQLHDVCIIGHFSVQAQHRAAGTVVVDDEVVNTDDVRMA